MLKIFHVPIMDPKETLINGSPSLKMMSGQGDVSLNTQYVNWITTKLEPSARAVFDSFTPKIRGDWDQLEPTLSEAFTDEHEKLEFLSRMDSFQRAPNMTLREYKNELQRRMYKYQPLLQDVPAEFDRSAVQRFREGIKDLALAAHLMMNCKGDWETLEHALEAAISWETTFKHFVYKHQNEAIQNGAKAFMGTMFGVPQMTITPMETPKGPDPISDLRTKVKEHELSIAELKAGQALTNDRIDSMEKTVRDDIKKLTKAVNVGFANTNLRQQFNPQNSQPQAFTHSYTDPQNYQPQVPRPPSTTKLTATTTSGLPLCTTKLCATSSETEASNHTRPNSRVAQSDDDSTK
jgi:uncharacterized protein YnzC (UPF0291/DUF896 family)